MTIVEHSNRPDATRKGLTQCVQQGTRHVDTNLILWNSMSDSAFFFYFLVVANFGFVQAIVDISL